MPRQPRFLTLTVLALALFLRVWVPAGWMPAASGGALAIEPCAAAGPMPMANTDPAHHGSQGSQHAGDCAFAPYHAGAVETAPTPALLDAVAPRVPAPQHVAAPIFATGPPALPPPATGPPALA